MMSPSRSATVGAWLSGLATIVYLGWLFYGFRHPPLLEMCVAGFGVGILWSLTAWGRSNRVRYSAFVSSTIDIHLLVAALIFGLALQQVLTEGITSDGCIYFAHLRSLVFDRDLDIAYELRVLRLPARPHHVVAFGAAIVWAPVYLLVRGIDVVGQQLGAWSESPRVAGLVGPYVRAALIPSYMLAATGLVALHMRLRREFGRAVALVTSLLLFGATPVAWYAIYEPSMAHAASFGLIALFLVGSDAWVDANGVTTRRGVVLGTLLGLAIVVRPQDALFVVFPIVRLLSGGSTRHAWRVAIPRTALLLALGAAPFLAVQLGAVSALMAGQNFKLMGSGGYLHPFDSRWMDVLFSSWHGFFSWTPVAYAALIGTIFYLRRDRQWALAALIVFATMSWVNGSADDWWGGWAFGGRRFSSTVAALGPGLALLLLWLRTRPLVLIGSLGACALGWNYLLMAQYHHQQLPRNEPIRFDTLVRQQGEVLTEAPFRYPFAFPANVWFAWREGVPVDRYDLLSPRPLLPRAEIVFDRHAEPFLLDGWAAPDARDGSAQEFWWLTEGLGTVVVPLDPQKAASFSVRVDGRTEQTAPSMLNVEVNGVPIGRLLFDSSRKTAELTVPASGSGRRIWRRGYNRVALRRTDTAVAPSVNATATDMNRPPGIAVYAIRIEPRTGVSSR